jgi:hypothetical protein
MCQGRALELVPNPTCKRACRKHGCSDKPCPQRAPLGYSCSSAAHSHKRAIALPHLMVAASGSDTSCSLGAMSPVARSPLSPSRPRHCSGKVACCSLGALTPPRPAQASNRCSTCHRRGDVSGSWVGACVVARSGAYGSAAMRDRHDKT